MTFITMSNEYIANQPDHRTTCISAGDMYGQQRAPQVDPLSELDHAFLREVHHKVKNNLQVVCSLLRLQGRSVSDPDVRNVFKRSEERIQSMALVYDKLYRGDGYDSVSLDEYLREMVQQLLSSALPRAERPQLDFCLEPLLVPSRTATTIGLLMNEVVSHHLRIYATSAFRQLKVTLSQDDSRVIIELREDRSAGVGHSSLGYMDQQILDALLKQVEGVITHDVEGKVFTRIVLSAC